VTRELKFATWAMVVCGVDIWMYSVTGDPIDAVLAFIALFVAMICVLSDKVKENQDNELRAGLGMGDSSSDLRSGSGTGSSAGGVREHPGQSGATDKEESLSETRDMAGVDPGCESDQLDPRKEET